MRMLIAATCAAVIAYIGYYFWGEYVSSQARSEREVRMDDARRELFDLAQAGSGEREKVVAFCSGVDEIIDNIASSETKGMWRQVKTNCRLLGYY